jgi:hypothetical protein
MVQATVWGRKILPKQVNRVLGLLNVACRRSERSIAFAVKAFQNKIGLLYEERDQKVLTKNHGQALSIVACSLYLSIITLTYDSSFVRLLTLNIINTD